MGYNKRYRTTTRENMINLNPNTINHNPQAEAEADVFSTQNRLEQ